MQGPTRGRFEAYLAAHQVGVFCLADGNGPWAMPVRYQSRELSVACVLPRWAEIAFRLERAPEVLLVVPAETEADRVWLACRGHARPGESSDWPDLFPSAPGSTPVSELYQLVEITARRLDLVDERDGWGRIDNLDL